MPKLDKQNDFSKDLVQIFNADALKALVSSIVKEELANQPTQATTIPQDDSIGVDELMQLTGYSKAMIYQHSFYNSFPFPCYRLGKKKLRFKRSEVLESLEKKVQNFEMQENANTKASNYITNSK